MQLLPLLQAAFAEEDELGKFVLKPKKWKEAVLDLVLEMEDEIPIWITIGSKKKLVSKRKWTKTRRALNQRKLARKEGKLKKCKPANQIIHGHSAGQDKLRVTLLDRSVVHHYFDKSKEPRGEKIKNILVVGGVHCRLDNITKEKPYRWLRKENLVIDGEEVHREVNQPTKGAMYEWCELRREEPELFAYITVMQSPAAYRDEITVSYGQEDLHRSYKNVLQQHDLLGSQFSSGARTKALALHQLKAIIAAEMTAILQLTDIMSAKKSKEVAKRVVMQVKRLQKRAAISEKIKPTYRFGKREMLQICNEIGKELYQWQDETDFIVKGMRVNGMFAYRPDFETKKLYSVEDEEWAKKYPLGAGGKVWPEWLEDRYNWLDEARQVNH